MALPARLTTDEARDGVLVCPQVITCRNACVKQLELPLHLLQDQAASACDQAPSMAKRGG